MKQLAKKQIADWLYIVGLVLIGTIAFGLRWRGIEHITADIETCLIPWSAEVKAGYGIGVLKQFDGDYNLPYVTVLWLLNYLPGNTVIKVKLFSIMFDYIGACGAGMLAGFFASGKTKKVAFMAAYTVTLLYPVTIMNSAYWGQCDFIYVAFLLYMLLCLFKGHSKMAMVFLGCAFSFKLQAILIVPFVLIYYWKKKSFSLWHFLIVPIVMEILCIPAMLAGYSFLIPFSVYLRQLGRYPYMYVFYPNLWALFKNAPYYIFKIVSIGSILCSLIVFFVVVVKRKKVITKKEWFSFAVWTVFLMMCLLPCMHERYGFLFEILTIVYAVIEVSMWWMPIIIGFGATISYLQVTFAKDYFSDQWIAVAYLLTFAFFTYGIVKNWKKENPAQAIEPEEKKALLNWEIKVMEWLEQYLIWIAIGSIIILFIAMRKSIIECMSPDYLTNLIETEGNFHTTFYMFGIKILGGLVDKPLLFLLKISCMAADFMTAVIGAVLIAKKGTKEKAFLFFALYIILPSTLLNSGIWAHVDSFCIFFLLLGYVFWKKERKFYASIMWGIGTAILTEYMLLVWIILATLFVIDKTLTQTMKIKAFLMHIFFILFMAIGLNMTGVFAGYTLRQCFTRMNFLKMTGTYELYPIIFVFLVLLFANIRYMLPLMLLEVTVILDWGQYLYESPVTPAGLIPWGYAGSIILGIVISIWIYKQGEEGIRNIL